MKSKTIQDATTEYVAVSNVNYTFNTTVNSKIGYLNVFNRGAWNVIDWVKITNKKAVFNNIGRNIVYLPSVFESGKMIFEKYPILLDVKGIQTTLKPDRLHVFKANLSRSNETKNEFKDNNPFLIVKGEKYSLYIWDGNWQLIDQQVATADDLVSFSKIPKNGLFLMAPSKPDFFERIFTVDALTTKITWYQDMKSTSLGCSFSCFVSLYLRVRLHSTPVFKDSIVLAKTSNSNLVSLVGFGLVC